MNTLINFVLSWVKAVSPTTYAIIGALSVTAYFGLPILGNAFNLPLFAHSAIFISIVSFLALFFTTPVTPALSRSVDAVAPNYTSNPVIDFILSWVKSISDKAYFLIGFVCVSFYYAEPILAQYINLPVILKSGTLFALITYIALFFTAPKTIAPQTGVSAGIPPAQ